MSVIDGAILRAVDERVDELKHYGTEYAAAFRDVKSLRSTQVMALLEQVVALTDRVERLEARLIDHGIFE